MRVLVVDDNQSGRELLGIILTSWGHDVSKAGDGEEALRHLSRHETALIMTDYRMPGMNGLALTKHIKAAKPAGVRVIIMSCDDPIDIEREACTMGAGAFPDAFVRKPFNLPGLKALIAGLFPG
jgi:two-component system response regulator PilR (NtrC family)/two-component system response regulator HydG